ncbi:MAG: DNA cytosine methyltransferase [Patescibacteria group bacterium]|nr:DNA cytosine methyltransferase [Patescibacteria group bacterium]
MKRLLDLYCGGGGASFGYELAGFEVTGVDINQQPNYVGEFVCDDAITFLLEFGHEFDAIHASPPCQQYSKSTSDHRTRGITYPDLVAPTREALISVGKPYVIENVPGAPLEEPILLCGTMFSIPTYRHRIFECSFPISAPHHPIHVAKTNKIGKRPKADEFIEYIGHFPGKDIVAKFTGLSWLTTQQLAQSIPPQYTRYIGRRILELLCQ